MKRYSWQDKDAIKSMSSVLSDGGLLLGSSDTVFGFLASVTDAGKDRLDAIKGRQNKPYLVLAGSLSQVASLVKSDQLLQVENLTKTCWPGPLTVIVSAINGAPECLQSLAGTIAVRVPKHAGLQALLVLTGPLFSTSANKTGQPVPETLAAMDPDLLAGVDGVVLDGENDASTLAEPSTIIDVTGDHLVMVREGAIKKADLECLLGRPF